MEMQLDQEGMLERRLKEHLGEMIQVGLSGRKDVTGRLTGVSSDGLMIVGHKFQYQGTGDAITRIRTLSGQELYENTALLRRDEVRPVRRFYH